MASNRKNSCAGLGSVAPAPQAATTPDAAGAPSCARRRDRLGSARRPDPLARVASRPDPATWAPDAVLTLAEAAALAWPCGPVPARSLRRAIADGRLPALRIAGRDHLVLGDLAAHLAS